MLNESISPIDVSRLANILATAKIGDNAVTSTIAYHPEWFDSTVCCHDTRPYKRRLRCEYCGCLSEKEYGTCEHCGAPL